MIVTEVSAVCNCVCGGCSEVSSFVPFTVEPESGVIAGGKSASIAVKFAPLDVNYYHARLVCT